MVKFQIQYMAFRIAVKVYIVHKYGGYLNKYPERVQICHLLYKCLQNWTFNCTVNWKCVQVSSWTKICGLNRVEISLNYKVCRSLLRSTLCIIMVFIWTIIRKCTDMSCALKVYIVRKFACPVIEVYILKTYCKNWLIKEVKLSMMLIFDI